MVSRGFHSGIVAALTSAALFGAGTPLAKLLLPKVSPWLMASLLYLGSGLGLTAYRLLRRAKRPRLAVHEKIWLAAAILAGGVVAPVLLMFGLTHLHASDASLLLNAESVFTAGLAWFAFKEHVDRRIALGMGMIIAGAVVLSWPRETHITELWAALWILGACFMWGLDNNLTRHVSMIDSTWLASVKGLVAGSMNLGLALLLGATWPAWPTMVGVLLVGWLAYGVSLSLFVIGLRQLGTGRTGAYFLVAPFFGAALAIPLLGEPVDTPLLVAGMLMGLGVWLHLTERHSHEHHHEVLEHDHEHEHDAHHQHDHDHDISMAVRHRHHHRHEALTHTHDHFPDTHHRHPH